jgi:hypothetical protein
LKYFELPHGIPVATFGGSVWKFHIFLNRGVGNSACPQQGGVQINDAISHYCGRFAMNPEYLFFAQFVVEQKKVMALT